MLYYLSYTPFLSICVSVSGIFQVNNSLHFSIFGVTPSVCLSFCLSVSVSVCQNRTLTSTKLMILITLSYMKRRKAKNQRASSHHKSKFDIVIQLIEYLETAVSAEGLVRISGNKKAIFSRCIFLFFILQWNLATIAKRPSISIYLVTRLCPPFFIDSMIIKLPLKKHWNNLSFLFDADNALLQRRQLSMLFQCCIFDR